MKLTPNSKAEFSKFTKIKIWLNAHLNDWPVFRVTYPNGEITYPLHYREAESLVDCFGGTLWLDYKYAYHLMFEL